MIPKSLQREAEFHCFYAADRNEALQKGNWLYVKYGRFLRNGPIVELGCGEGAFLLWLKEHGYEQLLGVESNEELCQLAESFGVPVVQRDLVEFLCEQALKAVYLYIDVIEHLPFETNLGVLGAIPVGSRLIIQTPNTRSLRGHEFYMNVPSHVAPYSPWVIRKLLSRLGYNLVCEGSVDSEQVYGWKRRLAHFLLRRLFALDPESILGGGNYFVVADRVGTEA